MKDDCIILIGLDTITYFKFHVPSRLYTEPLLDQSQFYVGAGLYPLKRSFKSCIFNTFYETNDRPNLILGIV